MVAVEVGDGVDDDRAEDRSEGEDQEIAGAIECGGQRDDQDEEDDATDEARIVGIRRGGDAVEAAFRSCANVEEVAGCGGWMVRLATGRDRRRKVRLSVQVAVIARR